MSWKWSNSRYTLKVDAHDPKMGEKEIKDNTKIFGRSYWKNELSLIKVGDVAEVADIKNNKRNSF